jgi:hypothetical protein
MSAAARHLYDGSARTLKNRAYVCYRAELLLATRVTRREWPPLSIAVPTPPFASKVIHPIKHRMTKRVCDRELRRVQSGPPREPLTGKVPGED